MPSEPNCAGIAATVATHRWRVAVHEAAHAVIAHALTIPCTLATIEPSGRYLGRMQSRNDAAIEAEWMRAGEQIAEIIERQRAMPPTLAP